jgi:hypothetical protein
MAGDAPYTVLVGAAGEGEQDSPRQPYSAQLFELLLDRGAEPFAIQVLYNTHFSGDVLVRRPRATSAFPSAVCMSWR